MSFFKDFLEKRKDSKYGKGHKLGSLQDTNTDTNKNSMSSSVQNRVEERPSTSQQLTQNEASKRAAEAALARQSMSLLNFFYPKKINVNSLKFKLRIKEYTCYYKK